MARVSTLHTSHPQLAWTNLGCEDIHVSQGESLHKQGEQVMHHSRRANETITESAGDQRGSVASEVEDTDIFIK